MANNKTVDRIQAVWNMIGGDDVVDQLLAGTKRLVVETVRRLTGLTPFTMPASERNIHDFFRTRKGLWLSDDFKKLILAAAQKGLSGSDNMTLGHCDLAEAPNDAEIRAELPEGHVFTDVNVVLVVLAMLIEVQWLNEVEGVLLNTVYRTNIFYVEIAGVVFTVRVYWGTTNGEWRCLARRTDADRWGAGNRAFSATGA